MNDHSDLNHFQRTSLRPIKPRWALLAQWCKRFVGHIFEHKEVLPYKISIILSVPFFMSFLGPRWIFWCPMIHVEANKLFNAGGIMPQLAQTKFHYCASMIPFEPNEPFLILPQWAMFSPMCPFDPNEPFSVQWCLLSRWTLSSPWGLLSPVWTHFNPVRHLRLMNPFKPNEPLKPFWAP